VLSLRKLFSICVMVLLAAPTVAASERETSPDGSLLLVQKTIGEEQWAISYRLRDGYVTGNVFRSGEAPVFLACQLREHNDEQTLHDCFNPDDDGGWSLLATVELPESFWAGAGQSIPAGTTDFCGPGTEGDRGICYPIPPPPPTCEAPLEECLGLLESCRNMPTEPTVCQGASCCNTTATRWNGRICEATPCPACEGALFCDPTTTVWNGSACIAATVPPEGSAFCGVGTIWKDTACVPERAQPACEQGELYDTDAETCVPAPCVWPQLGEMVDPQDLFFAGGTIPGVWNELHQAGAGLSATHLDLAKPTLQEVKDLCLEVVRLRDATECSDGYFWHREVCVCEHKRHC